MRITWLGHATALLELDGMRVLTDPVLHRRVGPLRRIAPLPTLEGAVDGVLLSHLHADHADLRSLRLIGPAVEIVAPPGAGPWLERRGFRAVRELAVGSSLPLGALEVTATDALHGGQRWRYGHHAGSVGYLIRGTQSVYFAGDTDLFPAMADLAGRVDVALLPVAGWGPTVGPGHLDAERAARAAALIRPRLAIPIHWGTLALPTARRAAHPDAAAEFRREAARLAPEVEVRVLAPGEATELAR